MAIRVLLVDDHKIMREGLKVLLAREDDIEVVAEAADGQEAIEQALALSADVVVMDLTMPGMNGISATRELTARGPIPRILALSMVADRAYVVEALKAGATGYLLKDCAADELVRAIRTVATGEPYLSAPITAMIIRDYSKGRDPASEGAPSPLTEREQEVLRLIAAGLSTKETASKLGVSIKTVETQRTSIMKKLNLFSVAELTKFAVREGFTSLY